MRVAREHFSNLSVLKQETVSRCLNLHLPRSCLPKHNLTPTFLLWRLLICASYSSLLTRRTWLLTIAPHFALPATITSSLRNRSFPTLTATDVFWVFWALPRSSLCLCLCTCIHLFPVPSNTCTSQMLVDSVIGPLRVKRMSMLLHPVYERSRNQLQSGEVEPVR